MGFKPSKYQEAVSEWIRNGEGNAMVEAVAGSGKTTTLEQSLNDMGQARTMFAAFNRHIAKELQKRIPPTVAQVNTIHSFGFSALRRFIGGDATVDKFKMRNIITEIMGDEEDSKDARAAAVNLCDKVRLTLTDPEDHEALEGLMDKYDINVADDHGWVFEAVEDALHMDLKTAETKRVIDFTDMLWIPIKRNLSLKKFDWIALDEAQDFNAAQRTIVLRAIAPAGRVLAVGDRNQSIYGFMGADLESIPKFIQDLDAQVLPLSICYRCPTSHLDVARKIVPHIEARHNAPVGEILRRNVDYVARELGNGDLVICRINAPLASLALKLIRAGKKAVIRGKEDVARGLISLIRRVARKHLNGSLLQIFSALKDYVDRESAKLLQVGKTLRAANLHDRVNTIIALADGIDTQSELEYRINEIFSDDQEGIVLSSIHRAKGLEADRVAIYRPSLLPFPMAQSAWEIAQEWNLKYVAYTRAKQTIWEMEY